MDDTEHGVQDDIVAGVGDGFPGVDYLLLEFVQERVVLFLFLASLVLCVALSFHFGHLLFKLLFIY